MLEIQRDSCLYRVSFRKTSHSSVPLRSYAQDASRNACWSAYGVRTYRCLILNEIGTCQYWHNSPVRNLMKICPEIVNMLTYVNTHTAKLIRAALIYVSLQTWRIHVNTVWNVSNRSSQYSKLDSKGGGQYYNASYIPYDDYKDAGRHD
jgi:hypothetical protein